MLAKGNGGTITDSEESDASSSKIVSDKVTLVDEGFGSSTIDSKLSMTK